MVKNKWFSLFRKAISLGLFDLKTRYKFSFLGYFWTLISPLSVLIILGVFFGRIIKIGIPNYPFFILIAYFPWLFYTTVVHNSSFIFFKRKAFLKNSSIDILIFPLESFFSAFFHFLLSWLLLFLSATVIFKIGVRLEWLYLLPLTFLYSLFLMGIAFLFSAVSFYFKDLGEFINIFLLIHFYLSPVFYSVSMIPSFYRDLYLLNPLAIFIEYYRYCFLGTTVLHSWQYLVYLIIVSLISFFSGKSLLEYFSQKGIERI